MTYSKLFGPKVSIKHILLEEQSEIDSSKQSKKKHTEYKNEPLQVIKPTTKLQVTANPEVDMKNSVEETKRVEEKPPATIPKHDLLPTPPKFPQNMYPTVQPVQTPLRNESQPMEASNQRNYIFHNPFYVNDLVADPYTPHFQQTTPQIPRPIFSHCAIHVGIAYFIEAIRKREVSF